MQHGALFDIHNDVNCHLVSPHEERRHGVQHIACLVTGKRGYNRGQVLQGLFVRPRRRS